MNMHATMPEPTPNKVTPNVAKANALKMHNLLALEAEVRKCTSLKQLQFLIANETAKVIPCRQAVVMHGQKSPAIVAITSLATLDKTSPTLRWLQKELVAKFGEEPVATAFISGETAPGSNWPFCKSLIFDLPIIPKTDQAKVALLSEKEFSETDIALAHRLAETYGHGWRALTKTGFSLAKLFSKKLLIASLMIVTAALFIPVPMSVLAPVEITARDPIIVAAPLNGVISEISVQPNSAVKISDLLFTYTATDLENELEISAQNVEVARSRFRRSSQGAFGAGEGRREMGELKSELELAQAKFNYAKSRLDMSKVYATREGVILFSDKDEWIGRPVSTGEKIMRIANPANTEFLVKLAPEDSIILRDGNDARIFLDADPLNPVKAKIVRRSYHAKLDASNMLAYDLILRVGENSNVPTANINHRIGIRGTAQVYGSKVPLGIFLFRKPLSAMRQYLGI